MKSVDLSIYDNSWYQPGGTRLKRFAWYFVNALLFDSWWCPVSTIKIRILRIFGARIGEGVVIKPRVNIKYPWNLKVGNHTWVGEGVWIDNLAPVTIGSHACISQGALLLTGNHDYSDVAFGLIVREIVIEDGAWIGARALLCPDVRVGQNAVITAGSNLQKDAQPGGIYQGQPAQLIRQRIIKG